MRPSKLFCTLICVCGIAQAADFFVSPAGNDVWSGILANPTSSDGPVQTIAKAISLAQAKRASLGASTTEGITIWLRNGTYFQTSPVEINQSLTGSTPTTIAAYPGEAPVISGGKILSGWSAASVNGHTVWQTTVPGVAGRQWEFHRIWVNGIAHHRARFPANGQPLRTAGGSGDLQSSFQFKAGDLQAWSNVKNAEAIVFTSWIDNHLPIASIDAGSSTLTFTKRLNWTLQPGTPYFLENIPDFLQNPGDWTIDYDTGLLTYYPMPGEDMSTTTVVVPVLSQVVRILGDTVNNNPVRKLSFKGITFSHNEWYFPEAAPTTSNTRCIDSWYDQLCPDANGYGQAEVGLPAMIQADGLVNSSFLGCKFLHIGTKALRMESGVQYDTIAGDTFSDLGGGAIHIGRTEPGGYFSGTYPANEQTSNNQIIDNLITNGGELFQSSVGIFIGQSHDNYIGHNEISDFFYSGISIGWSWGYQPTNVSNNVTEWNHIHHIGQKSNGDGPFLSDMGCYYSLGIQPGTWIQNNLCHDVNAAVYGGTGIYFDQATSYATAQNNITYNTFQGGFFQNWGAHNDVHNNIFAYDRERSVLMNQQDPTDSADRISFHHNIIYWTGTVNDPNQGNASWHVRPWGIDLQDHNLSVDTNLYWYKTLGVFEGEIYNSAQGYWIGDGFSAWQTHSGLDAHSILQDPLFNNPAGHDFSLPAGSPPTTAIGFKPFSLVGVGARVYTVVYPPFILSQATVQSIVKGDTALVSWTTPNGAQAMYLNVSTSPLVNANGTLQTVNVDNAVVTNQTHADLLHLASGTYYAMLVVDGLNQRTLSNLDSFTVSSSSYTASSSSSSQHATSIASSHIPAAPNFYTQGKQLLLELSEPWQGTLVILDYTGSTHLILASGNISAGVHGFAVDHLKNGVYLLQLRTAQGIITHKLTIIH